MQFGKYFACLLPVLSLVSGAFAQNNTLPTVPENSPYVTYIHGLGADGFYNASAETLTLSGAPSYFYLPGKTAFCNPTATPGCPTATLSVTVQIDNSGNLIGGNPVAGQPDLELTGQVTSGGVTYTSPLLTGTVTQFFYDGVNNTQNFDLRFAVTGGSMAALYLNPPSMDSDLWMTLNLEAVAGATDFQGTFGSSFGGEIKGDIYSTPGKCFGTIGDFVWNDLNANGIQDAGEPGINGVTVNLFDYQGNLLQSVATQQGPTGSQLGYYQFTGVCAGTYTVKVDETTLPKGTNGKIIFAETTPNAPGSTTANDSNPNPSTVTLATNDSSDETIDFGYVALQGAIGDYVWYDANGNGLQDAGEPGINGVTVDLYDSTQTNLLATTTTAYGGPNNVNGYYQFTGLSAGSYVVAVDSTTLPPSYTPTTSFVGSNSAIDSNGSPAAVTLATDSSVDETIDFGYVSPCNGTIGDFVWHDLNQNGIQDTGEPGIGGITLDLYNSAYTLIQTAITNGGGNYLFSGLCAGDYTVTVVGSTLPPNFTPTISQAPGSTTANDSNGSPAPVVLTTDSSNNVVSDLTIDFGYVSPCNGAIGDFVWWDQNGNGIQDAGEPGIANVTVSLYNSQMTLLNATTTNSVGYYQFTGLCAGTYIVQVTPPAGYSLTTANAPGSTLANDSNPNPSTVVLSITDSNGDITHDETIDFGFVLPTLSMTCASVTAGEVGVSFNSGAMTVTGGLAPYTFSVVGTLPAGLSLNASTGAVTGTPTASGSFTVQVTDAVGDVSTTCAITIVAGPSLSCSSVTSGEVGVAFNSGAMTVTGGTAPYTFSVSGTLPAGLSLNASTGAVTGTPTAAGSFSINVTDKNGITATGTCAITIVAGPSLSCSSVTSGEVGVAFNSGAMTVTGGTAPYTFSVSGTLPAGLSLNASTSAVTGTPTASGSFSIKVTDKNGITATGTCAITIVAGPSLSCSSVTSGEVGVAFNSGAMTVTGGSAPYTFSVSGTLPAGLSLNASTGAVTGTPTAAGSFSIKVTDANGITATGTCAITIVAGPSLSCSSVTSGEVGVAFNSGAMTVTGGSAPYTFSVSGTLPAGLSLNALTGAVTGTPTASGSFSIKVTDKNGITATGTCAITIVAGPSLSCSSVTSGEVGVAFNSGAMTVTGGSAPYTFSVSGTLPAGLSLNASTGAVTGTPTASGSFSIKVTDAKGAIITSNCTITIAGTAGPSCVFGVASAYNLVALTGNISDSADITGRIAADGQVTQATTIGTKLRTSDLYISEASKNGGPWAIVAAGGIPTSNSFNVNAGGNVYSSTATSASFNFANENYSGSPYENSKLVTGGSSPINFSTLQTEMYSLTKQLAGLTANGAVCSVNSSGKIVAGGGCPTSSTSYNPSWIVLYGTSATTNIFNLTQAQFQGSNNLDFVVPAGSTVIVNIAGTSDTLQSSIYFNGATVTDANASSILFNFATATTVTINAQFDATLLAPYAHLSGGSQMGGTFIAASVGSTGEVHYDAFTSTLPITGACSQ
jgi:choice-of-anchor A domain-containing protein